MEQFESINKDKDYVRELQKEIGTTADGIFGPGSYKAARQYFDKPIMIHMGKIVPIDSPAEIDLSAPLYELDDGTKNWYTRKSDPNNLCPLGWP